MANENAEILTKLGIGKSLWDEGLKASSDKDGVHQVVFVGLREKMANGSTQTIAGNGSSQNAAVDDFLRRVNEVHSRNAIELKGVVFEQPGLPGKIERKSAPKAEPV